MEVGLTLMLFEALPFSADVPDSRNGSGSDSEREPVETRR